MADGKLDSITIRYEDETLAIISKPAGVVVHAGHGTSKVPLLTAWLQEQWPMIGDDVPRAGLVHRLDKDTSGLLVIAKTAPAHAALAAQFADRTIDKKYQALVTGRMNPSEGRLEAPITRHHADRTRMTVRPDGKPATTLYKVIEQFSDSALLELTLLTGRTHQLRVHLAAFQHPIIGDVVYGQADPNLPRQFLHAHYLRLKHPITHKSLEITDPLPTELAYYLAKIKE